MSKTTVPEVSALSVQGPQKLIARATSTTPESINMGAWISDQTYSATALGKGRYVTVYAEDADLYVLFSSTAAASAATIDGTTNSATASAASALDKIPALIPAGTSKDWVLDPAYPYLHHVTKAGSGRIRVQRS